MALPETTLEMDAGDGASWRFQALQPDPAHPTGPPIPMPLTGKQVRFEAANGAISRTTANGGIVIDAAPNDSYFTLILDPANTADLIGASVLRWHIRVLGNDNVPHTIFRGPLIVRS